MTTDKQVIEMCSEFTHVLCECKKKIFEKFDEHGYDASFFDINISLSVRVDDIVIQCKEKWKRLE